jgi:subtilisin family serine protease
MKHLRIRTLLVLIVVLVSIGFLVTQSTETAKKDQSYIVIMDLNPVVTYQGDIPGFEATKPGKGKKINPNSARVKKYQKFLEQDHEQSLRNAGLNPNRKVHDYTIALNGYSAIMTQEEADAVRLQKNVVMVMEDQQRFPQTDSSPDFLALNVDGGPWEKEYDGTGMVVGVIDTGIWPEHPSFADDGRFPEPSLGPLPCEFGNTAHNPNDAPFVCNNKLIGAIQMLDTYRLLIGATSEEFDSARDDQGHGTNVASIAAGNSGVEASILGREKGTISGIAPRAHVIAYKALGDLGGFTSDLAAAIDQAVADGVDVINYSIGGGAAGPGADELAFLFAADAGVFAATSAGNSGPGEGTVGNPGTMPWITTVGAGTQERFFEGTIVLGDDSVYLGASVTGGVGMASLVDAEFAGGDLCIPGTLDPNVVSGNIVLCRRGVTARSAKSAAVDQAGGVGMILYNNDDTDNLFTDTHWIPSVHIDQTPGLAIKAYIASDSNPQASIECCGIGSWPYAPSMAQLSARGPNPVALDIIKPDLVAPGMQILAGFSPLVTDEFTPDGELFAALSGTSLCSPHVAGVATLIKQSHPDWSPAMIRSAMMTTADPNVLDNDRISMADPFDMGAGHIKPGGVWSKGSVNEPGLAYDAGFFEYLGFLCDAFPETFANPAATCGFLDSIGIPIVATDLNLPSIGIAEVPGSQTVQRTVTSVAKENGWRTYNVTVEAPPGFSVTVEPSSIRLKSGETATYYVTLTNVSAPVGEWRFGSLTWIEKSGQYSVRSPIATRASLF